MAKRKAVTPPETNDIGLKANQLLAIELLADPSTKLTREDIAQRCDVRRETIWAWLKRDDFKAALHEHINQHLAPLRARAMACLSRAMEKDDANAARGILQVTGDIGSGTNIAIQNTNTTKEPLPDRIREWRTERELVHDD